MRRAGWLVVVLLGLTVFAASADTGCGCDAASAPACYTTFRSNEIVQFSLTVPVDYFWKYDTSETPLITGWWVETPEGIVVKSVTLSEPKGHWASFTWNLSTDAGGSVEPGFYRIVLTTTSTAPVSADIQIVSCCCWPIWGCCFNPCFCQPVGCCITPCGEPYLVLSSGGYSSCCGLSGTIHISVVQTPP